MRILHTSDLHLGITIAGYPMLDEQRSLMQKLVRAAEAERADAVIIAGDVFDNAVASAEAVSLYDEMITRLSVDMGLKIFICSGNHDGAARLSVLGALLEKTGLYVAGGIRNGVPKINIGDCDFHLLPFFSLDEAKYLYPGRDIRSYGGAFSIILDDITARFEPGHKNILISHCYVSGAQVSESDRAVVVGGTAMVGSVMFEKFDYVALGHLHRPQTIGNARYSGSPMKLSFSESDSARSVTMIDTDTMEIWESPIIPSHDMRIVRGGFDDMLSIAASDEHNEDFIKIVLDDQYPHAELQDILRKYYPNLLIVEGKAYDGGPGTQSISMHEAATLSPEDIMTRFMIDSTGAPPSEKQLRWFREAAAVQEEEA